MNSSTNTTQSFSGNPSGNLSVQLVTFRWYIIWPFLSISILILIVTIFRVFHSRVSLINRFFPESCFLMVCGAILESIRRATDTSNPNRFPVFDFYTLFWILIPAGMFESAMQLHDRAFFNNIGSVLLFAVVGTVANTAIVAMILYAFKFSGAFSPRDISLHEILMHASLIAAVDPVAVLAIFEELHVNKDIYYLVFGESVLNDAVVVTIFNIISSLKDLNHFDGVQWILAIVGFFINSFAGIGIGIFYGLIAVILTKYTENLRATEPMILLIFAYSSYMTSELLQFSSIMAIISNGLFMSQYARHNISRESYHSTHYFAKTLANTADGVIFYMLGTMLIGPHNWNTGFILIGFAACLVVRFVVTYAISGYANYFLHRIRIITLKEQFLISYGGLRGAIALALATSISTNFPNRDAIITSTLFVIFITVFVMGTTTKPVVKLLGIRLETEADVILFEVVFNRVLQFSTRAMEDITGLRSTNTWLEKFHTFNEHYLVSWLVRRKEGLTSTEVVEAYEEIITKDALEGRKQNSLLSTLRKSANVLRSKLHMTSKRVGGQDNPGYFVEDSQPPYGPPRYTQIVKGSIDAGGLYNDDYRLVEKLPRQAYGGEYREESGRHLEVPPYTIYHSPMLINGSYGSFNSNNVYSPKTDNRAPPLSENIQNVEHSSEISNIKPDTQNSNGISRDANSYVGRTRNRSIVQNWVYNDSSNGIPAGGLYVADRIRHMQQANRRSIVPNYGQMLNHAIAGNEYYRQEFGLRNDEESEMANPNNQDTQYAVPRAISGRPPQYQRGNQQPTGSRDLYNQNYQTNYDPPNQLFHRKR